ncbi:MAG TPA: DNA replication/repair protein RecF [Actinomycetales bacterium]|nr:DNA replication/repair protein RecF [Actinomycetales bacterium]
MHLSHLALSDFRNYHEAVVEFSPGVMVLVGKNGQGKTNLVEAIAYLATFTSHRVSADTALVRAGTPGAVVRAKVVGGGRATTLELEIIAGRANRARLNRGQAKPRDLLGILRTVVFAPEDLALVKGDPAERRRLLDELMVLRTPRLAGVKSEYEKTLRQRSALLKQAGGRARGGRRDEYAESTLDVWDAQLASAGAQISVARAQLVADLAPHVATAYRAVSESDRLATIELRTSLAKEETRLASGGRYPREEEDDDDTRVASSADVASVAEVEERLRAAMGALRKAELERGVTLVGPHRDDLHLAIGELPAKGYASHGESWSLALALRIAEFELLRADDPDTPILILDDVFAELDSARRRRLAAMVGEAEQVFVTAAVAEDIPAELDGVRYHVEAGTIEREEVDE